MEKLKMLRKKLPKLAIMIKVLLHYLMILLKKEILREQVKHSHYPV
nr:MAG TPA: hypothetical protein [Caudoviricetes sp.]